MRIGRKIKTVKVIPTRIPADVPVRETTKAEPVRAEHALYAPRA